MEPLPRCISCGMDFPNRPLVLAALESGAAVRRDERLLKASELFGLYTIRHRIAVTLSADQSATDDLAWFVSRLKVDPEAKVRAYFIRAKSGRKFVVFEDDDRGFPLGCLEYGSPHEFQDAVGEADR